MLRSILMACNTSPVVRDPVPEPNCKRVQKINDDFYASSQGLKLCSFFEDAPNPVVPRNDSWLRMFPEHHILVQGDKAKHLVGKEKQVSAKETHANIVRFRSSSDPRWDSVYTVLSDVANEIKEQCELTILACYDN